MGLLRTKQVAQLIVQLSLARRERLLGIAVRNVLTKERAWLISGLPLKLLENSDEIPWDPKAQWLFLTKQNSI